MGSYTRAARYYDTLYRAMKDYRAEAGLVAELVRAHCPEARTLLDVGCGTALHARHLIDAGFSLHGIDLEPEFVAIAQARCPEGEFRTADMRSFDMGTRYDAVISLFSSIGYVRNEAGLMAALQQMANHVNPTGVVVVDPWFEPGSLTHGWITTIVGEHEGTSVCRMSRTLVDGSMSRLEFEYLVGAEAGIERLAETHELGLFTQKQMELAFESAGLSVHRVEESLGTRGMYVGTATERSRQSTL